MVIWVSVHGTLQNYFKEKRFSICLSDGEALKDLFLAIENGDGRDLPDHIWSRENHCFQGSVLVIINGNDIHDKSTRLKDGQEIMLITPVHGG